MRPNPPSEPDGRISRIRLSSRRIPASAGPTHPTLGKADELAHGFAKERPRIPCSPFEAASMTTESRNRMAATTSRSSRPLPVTRPTATGGKPRGTPRHPLSFTLQPPLRFAVVARLNATMGDLTCPRSLTARGGPLCVTDGFSLPSHPMHRNHPMHPKRTPGLRHACRSLRSGPNTRLRHVFRPNRVRSPWKACLGRQVRLRLLPSPPRGDAVAFGHPTPCQRRNRSS